MNDGLSLLIHGHSKTGKSWLADTSPAPRLVLDAEGGNGTRWTPSKKVYWNPTAESPPDPANGWETCIVNVRDFPTLQRSYDWFNSGQHPFTSVTLDSVGEIQQRGIDALRGADPMQTQDWGTLLRQMSHTIRNFRDLIQHPIKPLQTVVFISASRETNGRWTPYVQGQLATVLPYQMDVVGYLQQLPDPTIPGQTNRFLMIQPDPGYLSGERVGGRLGNYVHVPNGDQTITRMLDAVFNHQDTDHTESPAEGSSRDL